MNREARPVTLGQVLISIVIPAFNEAKYLPVSLEAAHRSRAVLGQAGWTSEVIVCDNNSTDETAAVARANGARVVFEPFNQIAASRNAAGLAARGDCLGGGCPIIFDSGPWLGRHTVIVWNLTARIMRWAAGSFLFCRASAFHELGGFSPDFFAGEEVDYCIRLNRLGRRLAKRMVYLNEPVISSGRKVKALFTWQNVGHGLQAIATSGDALKQRVNCMYWYDPVR